MNTTKNSALYTACMIVGGLGRAGDMTHPAEGGARQRDQQHVLPRIAVFLEMQQCRTAARRPECPAPFPGCAPAAAAGSRGRPSSSHSGPSVTPKMAISTIEVRSFSRSSIGLLVFGVWIAAPKHATPRPPPPTPGEHDARYGEPRARSTPAIARTGARIAGGRCAKSAPNKSA